MRAWQITNGFSIDELSLNTIPEPSAGPGQAVIRVRAVSLNFRDLLVTKGLYSKKLALPLTICSDCAGEVVMVGTGTNRVKAGDRVMANFMPGWIAGDASEAKARTAMGAFTSGVLAELIVLNEDALVHTPPHLSHEEAATLPCAAVTAWNALFEMSRCKTGESVLVQGSGGVSVFALQLAKAAGARVIAITSSDEKAARLQELGASDVLNYITTPDWEEPVRKLTGGGVDYVVEIGGAATMNKSIRAARMGGTIALIGNRASGSAEVNLTAALMKGLRIQGIFVGSREMFEAMNRAITLHRIRPVVDRVFHLEQGKDALRHLETGAHFGKVVIRV